MPSTHCPCMVSVLETRYRLLFKTRPPFSHGIVCTVVRNRACSQALSAEITVLCEEEIRTSLQGFSTYFHLVPVRWWLPSHSESGSDWIISSSASLFGCCGYCASSHQSRRAMGKTEGKSSHSLWFGPSSMHILQMHGCSTGSTLLIKVYHRESQLWSSTGSC